MKKNIYGLKDTKIGEFVTQFQVPNEQVALRQVKNGVNDTAPTELTLNTADFELYCLGEIDLATGVIEPKVDFIVNCLELKNTTKTKKAVK